MSKPKAFREQLLSVERDSTGSNQVLLEEIQAMFRKELTPIRKAFYLGVSIAALVAASVCGFLAITEPGLPGLARVGLGTGTLIGLAWFVVMFGILKRGSLDLRRDSRRIAQMVLGFTLLMVIFFTAVTMYSGNSIQGIVLLGQAGLFLVIAAIYWISFLIRDAELSLKERILQLELQLAQARNPDSVD